MITVKISTKNFFRFFFDFSFIINSFHPSFKKVYSLFIFLSIIIKELFCPTVNSKILVKPFKTVHFHNILSYGFIGFEGFFSQIYLFYYIFGYKTQKSRGNRHSTVFHFLFIHNFYTVKVPPGVSNITKISSSSPVSAFI